VTSFFEINVCDFLENDKTDLRQIFFSGFKRKHLSITTCIKKYPAFKFELYLIKIMFKRKENLDHNAENFD